MKKHSFLQSIVKSAKGFLYITPMLLSVILLVGLFEAFITRDIMTSIFNGNPFHDTLIGTLVGGVSVGQPIVSYIIGGELRDSGVSMYAVTAFILSWVTLGIVQLPLEYKLFGKRFTVQRNLLSFIFAIIVAVLIVQTLKLLA